MKCETVVISGALLGAWKPPNRRVHSIILTHYSSSSSRLIHIRVWSAWGLDCFYAMPLDCDLVMASSVEFGIGIVAVCRQSVLVHHGRYSHICTSLCLILCLALSSSPHFVD